MKLRRVLYCEYSISLFRFGFSVCMLGAQLYKKNGRSTCSSKLCCSSYDRASTCVYPRVGSTSINTAAIESEHALGSSAALSILSGTLAASSA